MACNYGALEDVATGCVFADECEDCDGECLNDVNSNGICDCFELSGCTDETACNYDPAAGVDDGSCTYAEYGYDCDGNCLDDDGDGICLLDEIWGCTDSLAINYYPIFTEDDGGCVFAEDLCSCPGDFNGDGFISVVDLLIFLGFIGYYCSEL